MEIETEPPQEGSDTAGEYLEFVTLLLHVRVGDNRKILTLPVYMTEEIAKIDFKVALVIWKANDTRFNIC